MALQGHRIAAVEEDSIAKELGIEPGDRLISINDKPVVDVFDYRYLIADEVLELVVLKQNGEEWAFDIEKDADEDLGLVFESALMDDYRSCNNHCIFCFIDQMPKGMRKTLYFKDDDARLSFLQGNYVTLTNLSDADIDRVIRYHLSPINISFHTTNPALRCMMLHNKDAGEALKKVDRLVNEGSNIVLNGQIVLCKGVNDKEELHRTISDLTNYLPNLQSVSVVPVGLSRYRKGLYPLLPFTKEDAKEVLTEIHGWQERLYAQHHTHFVHAADEFYMLAGAPFPEAEQYDGYLQLENGVGMMRSMLDEFHEAFAHLRTMEEGQADAPCRCRKERISLVTGQLAASAIESLMQEVKGYAPGIEVNVHAIRNDFFGEHITVTGLLTGADIIGQLRGKDLGERLLLPENVLRSGEDYLLDDVTVREIEEALSTPVTFTGTTGEALLHAVFGMEPNADADSYNPYELRTPPEDKLQY